MNQPRFSLYRDPDLKIKYSEISLETVQTVIGWWIYDPPQSCCCSLPDLTQLSVWGWISSGFLLIVCWPLTCLPYFLSSCHERYQIPVYL